MRNALLCALALAIGLLAFGCGETTKKPQKTTPPPSKGKIETPAPTPGPDVKAPEEKKAAPPEEKKAAPPEEKKAAPPEEKKAAPPEEPGKK